MDYMSERESLMYQAMGAFADAGMPLVVKPHTTEVACFLVPPYPAVVL